MRGAFGVSAGHPMCRRWSRWALSLAAGAAVVGYGVAASSVQADDTRDRIEAARQEAADREAEAEAFKREAERYRAELEAIDLEVIRSRRSQRDLKRRQKKAERALDDARAALEEIEAKLTDAREALDARLVALYKARGARGVPVMYAARDLQAGLRLYASMERVLAEDARLFQQYGVLREQWAAKEREARGLVVEIEGTEAEYLKRKQAEKQKLVERRNLEDLLRTRADRSLRVAEELRELAERLEEQLRRDGDRMQVQSAGLQRGRVPRPVSGDVRFRFGRQVDSEYRTTTQRMGIEIEADLGLPVRSVGAGRVIFADYVRGYGQMVMVDHGGGTTTVSGYLAEVAVRPKDTVLAGQVIGTVGETGSISGPGLYFEIRKDGKPVNPESWFEK